MLHHVLERRDETRVLSVKDRISRARHKTATSARGITRQTFQAVCSYGGSSRAGHDGYDLSKHPARRDLLCNNRRRGSVKARKGIRPRLQVKRKLEQATTNPCEMNARSRTCHPRPCNDDRITTKPYRLCQGHHNRGPNSARQKVLNDWCFDDAGPVLSGL